MKLIFCLRDECEHSIPEEDRDSHGLANKSSGTAYILVDNVVRTSFSFFVLGTERTDIPLECLYDICLHCVHHDETGECELRARSDCIMKIYCSTIDRVGIHELLHLCGCSEEELRRDTEALRKFYKERLCAKFERRAKKVIDDFSERYLNVAFLFDEEFWPLDKGVVNGQKAESDRLFM